MDTIKIPSAVQHILDTLEGCGYDAYVVGGCVRDSLMGKEPKDWDVTTSATPEQTKACFDKTIDTGIKHGTITVMLDGVGYEVTTFRTDGKYTDCRRPDCVTFTASIEEDLARRDFTMNAIAYHPTKGFIDPWGGRDHIKSMSIYAVGKSYDRFTEDPLRMLRAVRFVSRLGFEFYGYSALCKLSGTIVLVSQERIRDELVKILTGKHVVYAMKLLLDSGLLKHIIPEMCWCVGFNQNNPNHYLDVYEHTIKVLDNVPPEANVRLAALLHDIAKPLTYTVDEQGVGHFYGHHMKGMDVAENILKRLKFDNHTISTVSMLVREHMSRYEHLRGGSTKKLIRRVGEENLATLFQLQRADMRASLKPDTEKVDLLEAEVNKIINEKQPLSVKDLAIGGDDLIALGMKPGREMGQTLNWLLEQVLEDATLNTRETLLQMVITR